MNVGSILNDDTPSDGEGFAAHAAHSVQEPPQRNSIVSLLNDDKTPTPENDEDVSAKAEPETQNTQPEEQSKPAEPTSSDEKKSEASSTEKEPETSGKAQKNTQLNGVEEDEITKLNKLKGKSKPKRYEIPPIWAQEWIPKSLTRKTEETPVALQLSEKSIFNSNTTSSVDLECCITGVIPPPSVTRRIAEWIYANFVEISDANRQNVELELKFGTITDRKTNNRINILVSTECIFTDVSNIYFDSGIHQVGFEDMLKFFEELEKSYQEDLKTQPPGVNKPRRKFNILETDVTDSIYYVRNRNEQPKSIRVSKDNLLNPPRYTGINKQRISDLYIHNPSSMYDLRLSLSLENPIAQEEVESVMKKSKPDKVRIKQRNSFHHKPTITQFDLTRVTSPKELRNTHTGKRIVENEKSFEVELEVDIVELFNGFDMFKNGVNSIRFEELVEIFVNNARCLNNRVNKLAK